MNGQNDHAQLGDGISDRNAVATNQIAAAILAADVICGVKLGEYSVAADHEEAVRLLRLAGEKECATTLKRIVGVKTEVNYGETEISAADATVVARGTTRLIERAQALMGE